MRNAAPIAALLAFLSGPLLTALSQDQKAKPPFCSKAALAALRPLPKLKYRCISSDDSDDKILKQPARQKAIRAVEAQLALLNSAAWWQQSVDALNACYVRRTPGQLTDDQKEKFDYGMNLSGDERFRLISLADPCYQTGYNGSIAFLLYYKAGNVFVTQVLDGYFSRADNSLGIDYANHNGDLIIEIATGTGGLHPEITNYYFVIDRKTNHAVPKRLFKAGKGLVNSISSALLLSSTEDAGLPEDAAELSIIRKHALAPSFSFYDEDDQGTIEASERKFTRTVLKWNGRYYE